METFAVIFSSLILGTIVGWTVSLFGALYYTVFFELPTKLYFPLLEFGVLVGFLSFTSVVTTYFGLRGIVYHPIAKILKGMV